MTADAKTPRDVLIGTLWNRLALTAPVGPMSDRIVAELLAAGYQITPVRADDGVRVEVALRHALETLRHARVFVTSKEKIKHPEGTDLYDGIIKDTEIALAEAQAAAETRREAPVSCPNCFDRSDCSSVDICNAVAGAGRDAEARRLDWLGLSACNLTFEMMEGRSGHERPVFFISNKFTGKMVATGMTPREALDAAINAELAPTQGVTAGGAS